MLAEGRFKVTIGSTVREMGKGSRFIVPAGTTHGVVAPRLAFRVWRFGDSLRAPGRSNQRSEWQTTVYRR